MSKIDLDTVKLALNRNEVDEPTANRVIEDLNHALMEERAEKADQPKPEKKQFVMLVSDPGGELTGKDLTGWVVQIPESESPGTAPERVHRAAYEFNASPKGRRMPVRTVGEACEVVQAKFFKDQKIWVKTKEPVEVLPVRNEIPIEATTAE